MRYAVLGGGKRLRPALCLAACEACGADPESVAGPAAAIEMIHTYSLVHDDLPAMDDDALRRGRPTLHVAFGEAEAVLAGDALLTLAFEILAREPAGPERAERRAEAIAVVAAAAGAAGMVGGQMADLEAERAEVGPAGLDWIHAHKTGALLAASVELGAIHAGASADARAALVAFGRNLGMAFQIVDDILDVTATAEDLGKTPGKDARSGKGTYPARFGLEGARREAERFHDRAIAALDPVSGDTSILESLARGALGRKG
jgi:geranylgeranyl diphosphate synthase type II